VGWTDVDRQGEELNSGPKAISIVGKRSALPSELTKSSFEEHEMHSLSSRTSRLSVDESSRKPMKEMTRAERRALQVLLKISFK
jgi:translation initiation factor eIF-2B subunit delta